MKRPDYRTLQALDAVIRERGFERAAQKLCITQSAVSQRIKQLENMFGQPLLVRTVPPRPTEQGQKLLALLRQVELLEEEWLGDEQTGSTPLLLSLAVNADSLATWLLPALAPVLADSPIRLNLQVEDETRTQERLRRGEVVGAVSIQHQALAQLPGGQTGRARLSVCRVKAVCRALFPQWRYPVVAAESARRRVRPSG
ncbi:chromosome intitiation inhibitor [Salmonella enterica subsp. enterica serovar Derby]|nr:chromosome intitiation inhibitor [Salmonella enterica subsp. enterica serovar Derby]